MTDAATHDVPIPANDTERVAALRAVDLLDTAPEPEFDAVARLASLICQTPMALVSFVDADRQWFKARVGLQTPETDRAVAFCAHAIAAPHERFVVPDATQDERFRDNPLVTGPLGLRFYAGIPLLSSDGHALGTLCVLDRQPRGLSDAQAEALTILAQQATTLIQAREAAFRDASALEQRDEEQDRFFTVSLDLLCICGADGRFKRLNPAWEHTLGYSLESLTRQPFLDFVHPDDRESTVAEYSKLLEGQPTVTFENRYRHRDGSYRWLLWNAAPYPEDGLIYATARDITQRKLAAEALEQANLGLEAVVEQRTSLLEEKVSLLEIMNQICKSLLQKQDSESLFRVLLARLEGVLKLDTCKILLKTPGAPETLTVVARGPRDRELHASRGLLEGATHAPEALGLEGCLAGEPLRPCEAEIPAFFHDGLGVVSLRAFPLTANGEVEGALVVGSTRPRDFDANQDQFLADLSEFVALIVQQRQLQEELRSTYQELRTTQLAVRQQDRLNAMGHMACGIVHDINNALSPITGYIDLLLDDGVLDPRTQSYLQIVRKAGDSLAETVARLREFYRSRAEEEPLKLFALEDVARDVVELNRPRWKDIPQRDGVTFDVELSFEPGLPLILGARNELKDAVTNLLVNAIDAMPHGGTIYVRTARRAERLILEVQDSGKGMGEETREHCLEPFFTTKGEAGTGMGLAMVFGAVERHGGVLEIESQPSGGSTFRLSFPGPAPGEAIVPPPQEPEALRRRLRALCVDDDPLLRELVRELLEQDGHLVTLAPGGAEALRAFEDARVAAAPFDVVLTDLGMPEVDGVDIARGVKATSPGAKVIMLTGWGGDADRQPRKLAGVDRVLRKPPRLRELRQALHELFPED